MQTPYPAAALLNRGVEQLPLPSRRIRSLRQFINELKFTRAGIRGAFLEISSTWPERSQWDTNLLECPVVNVWQKTIDPCLSLTVLLQYKSTHTGDVLKEGLMLT